MLLLLINNDTILLSIIILLPSSRLLVGSVDQSSRVKRIAQYAVVVVLSITRVQIGMRGTLVKSQGEGGTWYMVLVLLHTTHTSSLGAVVETQIQKNWGHRSSYYFLL